MTAPVTPVSDSIRETLMDNPSHRGRLQGHDVKRIDDDTRIDFDNDPELNCPQRTLFKCVQKILPLVPLCCRRATGRMFEKLDEKYGPDGGGMVLGVTLISLLWLSNYLYSTKI